MQITYKGDYSLKAILDLAIHYGQEVVSIHDLAKRIDAPVKFLEQVLLDLKKGGFVDSKRGVNGGYYLSKPPRDISVGEVARFVDGPIEPVLCANTKSDYKGCTDIHHCVLRDIWVDVAKATSNIIANVSFQDLVDKNKATFSKSYLYNI